MTPILFLATTKEQEAFLHRYESYYTIQSVSEVPKALESLAHIRRQGSQLALILVDSSNSSVLQTVRKDFPNAKRVILATAGEQEALNMQIDAILTPPLIPMEEFVYPVLDSLLEAWREETSSTGDDVIRVVGNEMSSDSYKVKQFLTGFAVPYQWQPLVSQPQAGDPYPQVLFPDGVRLVGPTLREIADKLRLQQTARSSRYDLVIVGAGPAGLAAAIYGGSEGLRTLLVEREALGGQAGSSSRIENYPGFPVGLTGDDLTRRMVAQVHRFGVDLIFQEVIGIHAKDTDRIVHFREGDDVRSGAVLLATGVGYRTLDVPGCNALTGAGVYYGASLTETEECRGKDVYILGGANSAGQAALHFADVANQVTMLIRGDSLQKDMSQYLIDEILRRSTITIRTHTTVVQVGGEKQLKEITLSCQGRSNETLPASALFVFIGALPKTEWLSNIVARDEQGFILSGSDVFCQGNVHWPLSRSPYHLETSMPGVFTAGDVRSGSVKRAATGVGEGSMSVPFIHSYLTTLR